MASPSSKNKECEEGCVNPEVNDVLDGMDEPDFAKILYEGHPADGTNRAAYQFLIFDPQTGAPVRFLLTEADNSWAVAALEKILLRDGHVNDTCRIIAVFRDHRVAGVRDSLLEEIPYHEFMLDMVDSNRLTGDVIVSACFSKSLSKKERDLVRMRIAESTSSGHSFNKEPEPELDSQNSEILTSALCGMGFKKPEVKKFVASLGIRVKSEPVQTLLKEGLKILAA